MLFVRTNPTKCATAESPSAMRKVWLVGIIPVILGSLIMTIPHFARTQGAPAPDLPLDRPPVALPQDFLRGTTNDQVAFSPCNRMLAISGQMHCNHSHAGLLCWELDTDCKRFIVQDKLTFVYAFAFSPDGKYFATGHRDGAVRLWDAGSYKMIAELGVLDETVLTAQFSHDGKMLVTGDDAKQIVVWDLVKKNKRQLCLHHDSSVEGVAFSIDDKIVVSAGRDGNICFTDVATGKLVETMATNFCLALALSADGTTLALGTNEIEVVAFKTRKKTMSIGGLGDRVNCVCFSRDGSLVAGTSQNGFMKVWDLRAGKERFCVKDEWGFHSASFSADGSVLATAIGFDCVKLWDTTTGKEFAAETKKD